MDKLPLIELADLNRHIVGRDSYRDLLSIADINGKSAQEDLEQTYRKHQPMRLDALLIVVGLEGTLEISLDYTPYKIKANSLVLIMPTHILQFDKISKNFKGCLLIASRTFMDECSWLSTNRSKSVASYLEMRKNPHIHFDPCHSVRINNAIEDIRRKIKEQDHTFWMQMVQFSFVSFLMELGHIIRTQNSQIVRIATSRKEELFEQFLQLLMQHCKECHIVTFYAEKLCITPQYLSLILKELTGKSANVWIDDALLVEAKILLKNPQVSIQQVADELHFSDQSTFGKFFKKHMGISPMEFRKS